MYIKEVYVIKKYIYIYIYIYKYIYIYIYVYDNNDQHIDTSAYENTRT